MYSALIQPVFDYCDAVWGNLNKGLANRLQKLQNRAQSYDVRSKDLLEYLNWDNLALRRDKRLSTLMFDTINYNVPKYLSELFHQNYVNKPYKSRLRDNALNVSLRLCSNYGVWQRCFSL